MVNIVLIHGGKFYMSGIFRKKCLIDISTFGDHIEKKLIKFEKTIIEYKKNSLLIKKII